MAGKKISKRQKRASKTREQTQSLNCNFPPTFDIISSHICRKILSRLYIGRNRLLFYNVREPKSIFNDSIDLFFLNRGNHNESVLMSIAQTLSSKCTDILLYKIRFPHPINTWFIIPKGNNFPFFISFT